MVCIVVVCTAVRMVEQEVRKLEQMLQQDRATVNDALESHVQYSTPYDSPTRQGENEIPNKTISDSSEDRIRKMKRNHWPGT